MTDDRNERERPTPGSPAADGPTPSRRLFLSRLVGAIGGAIGATLAGIGLTTFAAPAFSRREAGWVRVAELDPDRVTRPRPYVVSFRRRDGWYAGNGQAVIFVAKDEADRFMAMSSRCTHLGCGVHWDNTREQFLCPCHGGAYDATGKVTAGPPPKPLTRLETRFEAGVLYVRGEGLGA